MAIKWNDVKIGTSPLTNSIFIGKTKVDKSGLELWTDRSDDKTQDVLKAVLDWFNNRYEYEGKDSVGIVINDKEYKLLFSVTDVEVEE